jgi:hypothetical protein
MFLFCFFGLVLVGGIVSVYRLVGGFCLGVGGFGLCGYVVGFRTIISESIIRYNVHVPNGCEKPTYP